jgi:hypothetical protein
VVGALLLGAFAITLAFSQPAQAATRTWTGAGATNNWTDAANWAGSVIPGASDIATFDGTSTKNATINASITVAGITINAGYTGTIAQSAGFAATIGASGFSQASGTFSGGTAAIAVNGAFVLSGGTFTATAGTLSISGNFTESGGTFNHNGGTVCFCYVYG